MAVKTCEEDKLSERELILCLLKEVRESEQRLRRLEANQTLLVGWAREIALARNNEHVVAQIDAYLDKGDAQAEG